MLQFIKKNPFKSHLKFNLGNNCHDFLTFCRAVKHVALPKILYIFQVAAVMNRAFWNTASPIHIFGNENCSFAMKEK